MHNKQIQASLLFNIGFLKSVDSSSLLVTNTQKQVCFLMDRHSYGRPIFVEHILHSRQQRLAAFYLQKLDKKCLYCFGEWTKTRFFSSSDIANVWPIAFQYQQPFMRQFRINNQAQIKSPFCAPFFFSSKLFPFLLYFLSIPFP